MHGLLPVQLGGVPAAQLPFLQVSWPLQTVLSSQLVPSALGALWQPLAGLQEPVVQAVSGRLTGVPPVHCRLEQCSPVVQALPSSHVLLLAVCTQPLAALQESSVHTLPSSQL